MKKVSKAEQIKRQKIAQKRADYTKARGIKQAALKLKAAESKDENK